MSKKGKLGIAWGLLIFWMGLIFFMSNQPANISNSQSNFIIELIKKMGVHINEQNIEGITTFIRKGAHFSEYTILGILGYNVIRYYIYTRKARFLALVLVVVYACSDEIHQIFIPGRAGRFTDIIIDSCGGAFAFLIIVFINMKNRWLSDKL